MYGGSGDPKRVFELLWDLQDKPRRGPKARFTLADVVGVALRLADAEGLEALSMRRVAADLGITAMSLYSYVPSKAELIDVLIDRVLGEMDMREVSGDWRDRLEHVARENWRLNVRHPWLLQVSPSRPVMGPHLIAKYDYELRAVHGIGLSPVEMDLVVGFVTDYAHGAARNFVEAAQVEKRTGSSDVEWWEEMAPLLEKVFDAEKYPVAAEVGPVVGEEFQAASDPGRSFEFGLVRLLDGIAVLVESKRA